MKEPIFRQSELVNFFTQVHLITFELCLIARPSILVLFTTYPLLGHEHLRIGPGLNPSIRPFKFVRTGLVHGASANYSSPDHGSRVSVGPCVYWLAGKSSFSDESIMATVGDMDPRTLNKPSSIQILRVFIRSPDRQSNLDCRGAVI